MIDFPAWQKYRQKKGYSAVVTPLMDIMFLLLLFFILTSSLPTPVLPVDLSNAESAVVSEEKHITIVITKDGETLFDGKPVLQTDLVTRIHTFRAGNPGTKEVVIAVDRDAPFHFAAHVMDLLRLDGIQNVSLMMEKQDE